MTQPSRRSTRPARRAAKRRRAGQERDLERPANEAPPPPPPRGLPVDGVDLVFYDREDAEAARPLCWLHELGCLWQEDATHCHDLLEGYTGIPVEKPDWVREVEARDDPRQRAQHPLPAAGSPS